MTATAVVFFYEKPGCATNARQRRLLEAAGHRVVARNLLAEAWTAERLREFFQGTPVTEWFNPAAPRIKSGEVDPQELTPEHALFSCWRTCADPQTAHRDGRFANGRFRPATAAAHPPEQPGNTRDTHTGSEACSRLPEPHRRQLRLRGPVP
jgi:nitrogenase-associated protein